MSVVTAATVAVVVAVLVMVAVLVVVVEEKQQRVGYMFLAGLHDPLETMLIQLAKNAVGMSIFHQRCTCSHEENFETLEVATASTVAVVVVGVQAVVDVSPGANLVLHVRFLQMCA